MKIKSVIVVIGLLFLALAFNVETATSTTNQHGQDTKESIAFSGQPGYRTDENIIYAKIDGFEEKNSWIVKFSKFRSMTWKEETETKKYLPANKWLKWIKADDSKALYERKYLVPPGVYRNPYLKDEVSILSVRGRWDRRGNNWLALLPSNRRVSEQDKNSESLNLELYEKDKLKPDKYIILPGKTYELYCYFWGMGYNYKVEIHVQDYLGNYYVLPGSYLNFYGWRNVRFDVPSYVKQDSRLLPRVRSLRLVQIKIVAAENEVSKGFYTYVDYLHSRCDIYERSFFGSRLKRDDVYWKEEDDKEII